SANGRQPRQLHLATAPADRPICRPSMDSRTYKLPFADLLGIRVTEASADLVVAEMEVRPELCTTPAVLHGGAVMAFADTLGALGTLANLPEGAGTTTIESKTNFIGAAPVGTTVMGT